jgi:hypothetical protein
MIWECSSKCRMHLQLIKTTRKEMNHGSEEKSKEKESS